MQFREQHGRPRPGATVAASIEVGVTTSSVNGPQCRRPIDATSDQGRCTDRRPVAAKSRPCTELRNSPRRFQTISRMALAPTAGTTSRFAAVEAMSAAVGWMPNASSTSW